MSLLWVRLPRWLNYTKHEYSRVITIKDVIYNSKKSCFKREPPGKENYPVFLKPTFDYGSIAKHAILFVGF